MKASMVVKHCNRKWDTNDSYHNDRVKEIKDLDVIAEVNTFADIAGLGLIAPTVTQFIYVAAENYYYNWNATLSIWEPFSENHLDYEEGQMTTEFAPMLSPLCEKKTLCVRCAIRIYTIER